MATKGIRRELAAIEEELQAVVQQLQEKRQTLLQAHLDAREPVEKRRYELVNGLSRATDAELDGYTGPRTTGAIKPQPVPGFWLHALCAEPRIARWVTSADRGALELLRDVRLLRGAGGMLLEFHFPEDNPYFDNTVLRRGIAVEKDPLTGQVTDVRDEGTVIDWKEGKSLLLQPVKPAGGHGGGKKKKKKGGAHGGGKKHAGKGGKAGAAEDEEPDEDDEPQEATHVATKLKPAPSFFRFFTGLQRPKVVDPTALDVEDEEDDPQAALEDAYFLGDEHERDHDDEDDEEEEEDGGEEDEEGMPHFQDPEARRMARAMKRKADRDMGLLDVVVRRVLPRAATLYQEGLQASSASFEEEDDAGFTVVHPPRTAGSPPPTPAAVQQAVHALLQHNQQELDRLSLEFKKAKWRAAQEADEQEQRLLDRRAALLGKAAGPITPSRLVRPVAAAVTTSPPLFWLRALRGCEGGSDACVHRRDELALASLVDVRARWDWSHMPTAAQPWRKVTVEWTFLDNPYFPATTLSKSYTLACDGGSANKLDLEQRGRVLAAPQWFSSVPGGAVPKEEDEKHHQAGEQHASASTSTSPQQHEQHQPKAGRPGRCDLTMAPPSRGSKKHHNKPVPALSFFNLFKDGYLRHAFSGLEGAPGSSQQEQEALAAEEALLGALLSGPLRYAASVLYDQVEVEEEDLGHEWNELDEEEEEEGEDGDEEEDDEEEEDGGEGRTGKASRPRGPARRKARRDGADSAAGSGWGKYTVFVGLMMLLVLAQVFVWLDMFFFSKR